MTLSAQDRKKRDDMIRDLIQDICGDTGNVLDDLVHEAKAEEAASINNDGVDAQIAYLVDSWGITDVDKTVRETLGLPKRPPKNETKVVIDSLDQHIKCKHCGQSEPVPFPMEVLDFVRWSEDWTKPHVEAACLKESAGGGAPPSTGQSSSSTPS